MEGVGAQQTEMLGFPQRPPAHCDPRVLRPANDDHLLILPKKLPNPVMESKNHKNLNREIKINNKLGIDVLNQKSELDRVFREKKREEFKNEQEKNNPKSEFQLMIEQRRKEQEEQEHAQQEEMAKPEFLRIRNRLVKPDSS